jgi:hypothetical protein
MSRPMRRVLIPVAIASLFVAAGAWLKWSLETASGQATTVSVSAPSSWPVAGGEFQVSINISNVSNLASYEWQLSFDPTLLQFVDVTNGPLLASTGRTVVCEAPIVGPAYGDSPTGPVLILEEGNGRFGCLSTGATPPGPAGSGLLSTVTFAPVASGNSNLELAWVQLSDPLSEDIPTNRQGDCIGIGTSGCATPTEAPPASPTLPAGATPPSQETPSAAATPTPTPTGPTPTPTPLPPGWEAIPLYGGCQFEAWTGANGTAAAELAGLVGPAGNLIALWAQPEPPLWRGYSPQYPQVSDLEALDLLDVVAICARGPGAFSRPII